MFTSLITSDHARTVIFLTHIGITTIGPVDTVIDTLTQATTTTIMTQTEGIVIKR